VCEFLICKISLCTRRCDRYLKFSFTNSCLRLCTCTYRFKLYIICSSSSILYYCIFL